MAKRKSRRSGPRGLHDGFDNDSNKTLLVRAAVSEVSSVIGERFGAYSREVDVGYRPVAGKGTAVFVGQLVGHVWSVVLEDPGGLDGGIVSSKGAQVLSEALDTQALVVVHEDTSNFYGYELFQSGLSVEYFGWGSGDDRFRSSVGRKLTNKELLRPRFNGVKFINATLTELEAFVPPVVTVRLDEDSCMVIAGDEEGGQWDESMWARIDCVSVPESRLPAGGEMDLLE